jgi:hypothetical protein
MSILDAVRRPEYTGDRRCWPCTAVNAAILVLVAGVTLVLSPLVSLLVLAGGGALVYLRGYVVPGTPEFAPRLVATLGLDSMFPHATDGGQPRRSDDLTAVDVDGEELMLALFRAGVLEERPDGALSLSGAFEDAWESEMAKLREHTDDAVADAVADAAPFEATGEAAYGGLSVQGPQRGVWLSRAHGVADAAAVRTLADFDVDERLRAHATTPLRMFLETCPVCAGAVVETTTSECCGGTAGIYDSPTTDVLACEDCGAIVYEFEDEREGEESEA